MAAKATFALKAGVWFRRGRLLIIAPVHKQAWQPRHVSMQITPEYLALKASLWQFVEAELVHQDETSQPAQSPEV